MTSMRFQNGWGNPNKHADKFIYKLRIGTITVFDIIIDLSSKLYSVTFLNFTIKF
jgi:hypothetical protein